MPYRLLFYLRIYYFSQKSVIHCNIVPKGKEILKRVINFLSGLFVLIILVVSTLPAPAQQKAGSRTDAQGLNTDSLKKVRRQKADSLNFLRNYRQSKHYKDSIERARQQRVLQQKASQKAASDSLIAQRKRVADSIMAYRTRHTDSIRLYNDSIRRAQERQIEQTKLARKRVSDSLAVIRAYKTSKRYKDSVAEERQTRLANQAKARKRTSDSLKAIQKARTDSTLAVRKAYNDSLKTAMAAAKAIRTMQLDSLKAVRTARADSLAKVREARAALRKEKAEQKEKEKKEKSQLALELKIKKKQEKYTNEDMRKKKWTLPRKVIQNTFTRYNYYFNANRKMEEAVENMVRSNVDNYDSLIALFPFDPDRDSTKLLSDMDTIIHKSSVGIQIHDPRAKWQDNLYLLVGQAYYYKGDYKNAGAAFKQIVAQAEQAKKDEAKQKGTTKAEKNKPTTYSEADKTGLAGLLEHKSSKNEAMLWLSRVLTQTKKEGQAQTLLDMLRNDALFPERLKGRLALEQAFIELSRRDDVKAAQSLSIVSSDKDLPKWVRQRANFLNGQLMQQQLHYIESDQYFREVLNLNPDLEMEFYARKNIASNSINYGSNTGNAADMLDKMAADGKFRPYYDQIYYAMGKAALKNRQGDKALESFRKSVSLSQSNKKQKGLSFAAMGDEYYSRSDYNNAKRSYDSASALLTSAQDPVYSIARQRAMALDRVAGPGNEVKEQDSLLRLASLSEKEQRQAVREYLRDLERALRNNAYQSQLSAGSNVSNMNAQGNQSWYFANPNLMKQGENEFKQKWGNRPLKDNWRRSSAGSADFASGDGDGNSEDDLESSLPDADSLYAAIPHTPEQLQKTNDRLREGLFNLGKAYYTHLEDYNKAGATFDTLDRRFPNHNHQAEVLYTRYLMSLRQNQPSVAAQYNSQLQSRYPDSEWARLLKGASAAATEIDPFANVSNAPKETVSNFYDETYGLLIQRQYRDVLRRVKEADELYKNQGNFRKKFTLMKAIAVAGDGNYPEADTMLNQFINANPGDTLVNWANAVLEYIRKNPQASANTNSLQPQASVNTPVVSGGLEYEYKPATPHYVIFSAQQDAKFSGFRSGLSDYNLMKQGNEQFTVTMSTLDAGRSLVICKEFPNAAAAKKYMNEIRNVNLLFREYKAGEYDLLLISADNFPRLFVKKDYAAYKTFYGKNYK
jgi:tetratricopeptide (TPR) repeat protein